MTIRPAALALFFYSIKKAKKLLPIGNIDPSIHGC